MRTDHTTRIPFPPPTSEKDPPPLPRGPFHPPYQADSGRSPKRCTEPSRSRDDAAMHTLDPDSRFPCRCSKLLGNKGKPQYRRLDPEPFDFPIIVYGALPARTVSVSTLAAGADVYLEKPRDLSAIPEAIELLLHLTPGDRQPNNLDAAAA